MRSLLLVIGWAGVIGGVVDAVLTAVAVWVINADAWADPALSIDTLFRQHFPWLLWVKQVAGYIMPDQLVVTIFALPALLIFPVRVIISGLIGKWAFAKAKGMKRDVV